MEYLPRGITLEIPEGCFPLSTDSMVLSHFVKLPRNARVLDLGSGCGTLGLLLLSRDACCQITGVELDAAAHTAAVENIRRNGLNDHMQSICADLRRISGGNYDICLSNPPYYSGGYASASLPMARQSAHCSTEELCQAAGRNLKYGGDFYVVQKPENLACLITAAAGQGMEAKRLLLLRHRVTSPVSLVCLQFRKGGKTGLKIEEAALYHADGSPTDFCRQVYHWNPEE